MQIKAPGRGVENRKYRKRLERVQKVLWTQGAKVSQEFLAPSENCFAPVQPQFAPKHLCSLGPKHLLHPLLATFENFLFSNPCPSTLVYNLCVFFSEVLANFQERSRELSGRSPELVRKPPFQTFSTGIPSWKGFANSVPGSFSKSSRTPLSLKRLSSFL